MLIHGHPWRLDYAKGNPHDLGNLNVYTSLNIIKSLTINSNKPLLTFTNIY